MAVLFCLVIQNQMMLQKDRAIQAQTKQQAISYTGLVHQFPEIKIAAEEAEAAADAEEIIYKSEKEIEHERMKEMNSDYIGWLFIPGTEISYPVVDPPDNEYYLKHSFEKTSSISGALFIDSFLTEGMDSPHVIVYGHNMRNGSMFGTLKKFRNESYFNEHPLIEFHTPNGLYVYQIFSIREVSSDIHSMNFKIDDVNINEYVENARRDSIHFRKPETATNIVTLSTCVGNDSRRLLLSATRIYG